MGGEPDPVTGLVAEMLAVAGGLDHVAGHAVDLAARRQRGTFGGRRRDAGLRAAIAADCAVATRS